MDDTSRDGESHFKDLLARDNYEIKVHRPSPEHAIPSDCTAIVVAGPVHDYEQPEVDAIKTYVENGGRALFMLDPPLNMGPTSVAENSALTAVLASWGVTPDKDLVLDLNPVGQLFGLGPQVPLVRSYSSQPIVADMKGATTAYPMSRSLTLGHGEKTSVEKLFDSSQGSLATTNLSSPRVNVKDPNNKKGPMTLAAAGTYNTGKPNVQGRFVVVGSSIWASNEFIGQLADSDLAVNTVNWLCSDEDLISIHPKKPEDRHLTMTQGQMRTVRIVSQFILPLIVILAGILVWWKRR